MTPEIERLVNLERQVMAKTVIRDSEKRIFELRTKIESEERTIEKAQERLMEVRTYLRSIGEDIE